MGKDERMIAHLPTLMLVVGYLIFWIELYILDVPSGRTSPLAVWLFVGTAVFVVFRNWSQIILSFRNFYQGWIQQSKPIKFFLVVGFIIVVMVLGCGLYASLLPPHLMQESDALTYHISLPKQHLLRDSFSHIRWSTADLYFLPIDFALAPYWLVTALPNKFPQFLFLLGLVAICGRLTAFFGRNRFIVPLLVVLAIFGSHNVGIQVGTAMLDIVAAYLLFAALDSFLKEFFVLGGIELSFYFWSKSFIPIQSLLIVFILCLLWMILRYRGWRLSWVPQCVMGEKERQKHRKALNKTIFVFVISSLFIGGPFVAKSLYYTGTPLFPFYPGLVRSQPDINSDSVRWHSIVEKAEQVQATKDQYGSGRSLPDFIRHVWLIAVPEKGVNNRYDYPVGLMYLLFLGPFMVSWVQSLKNKEFSILPFFVIIFWLSWWLGSHQSRFLFVPIIMMFVIVVSKLEVPSLPLMAAVTVGLLLVALSVFRAHKADMGLSPYDVLREKDKKLLAMAKRIKDVPITLDFPDAAYADFSVEVRGSKSIFILEY